MVGSDLQEARTLTREASPHVAQGNPARSRSPQGRAPHAELAGGMMQNPQIMQQQKRVQEITNAIESRKAILIAEMTKDYVMEEEKT